MKELWLPTGNESTEWVVMKVPKLAGVFIFVGFLLTYLTFVKRQRDAAKLDGQRPPQVGVVGWTPPRHHRPTLAAATNQYCIMFDAGSTGTRIHVFQFMMEDRGMAVTVVTERSYPCLISSLIMCCYCCRSSVSASGNVQIHSAGIVGLRWPSAGGKRDDWRPWGHLTESLHFLWNRLLKNVPLNRVVLLVFRWDFRAPEGGPVHCPCLPVELHSRPPEGHGWPPTAAWAESSGPAGLGQTPPTETELSTSSGTISKVINNLRALPSRVKFYFILEHSSSYQNQKCRLSNLQNNQ